MFAKAFGLARQFTAPVIVSTRQYDGTVSCGCGAFVHINKDGWVITVAHLWESFNKHQNDKPLIEEHKKRVSSVEQDTSLGSKKQAKKMSKLRADPTWLTHHSFWWGRDGVHLINFTAFPEADLVLGRLVPFDPKWVNQFPVFKNPAGLAVGSSLCKLGYPFHNIAATYDESKDQFVLAQGAIPPPLFPIEGIYTRDVIVRDQTTDKVITKFIETSSPGLRGQSGGPTFDAEGNVWAIQSGTQHFPLGFSPKVKKGHQEVEENQFLNVGWGIHPEVIVNALRATGVDFSMTDANSGAL